MDYGYWIVGYTQIGLLLLALISLMDRTAPQDTAEWFLSVLFVWTWPVYFPIVLVVEAKWWLKARKVRKLIGEEATP